MLNAIDTSIESLFGPYCSSRTFAHDAYMAEYAERQAAQAGNRDSQRWDSSFQEIDDTSMEQPAVNSKEEAQNVREAGLNSSGPMKRYFGEFIEPDESPLDDSQGSAISGRALEIRRSAFDLMVANENSSQWRSPHLISTSDNHSRVDDELGG